MGEAPGDAKKNELLRDISQLDDPASDVSELGVESGVSAVPHPTIVPAFNPSQYAEESEIRERMPTLTDENALESARLRSLPSNMPPPRRPLSTIPGAMVTSLGGAEVEVDTGEVDLDDDEQAAILQARLAPLARIPMRAKPMAELGPMLSDPKTAYVLGFVDGILPLETIIEVTGLPELETLEILERMIAQGIVIFRASR